MKNELHRSEAIWLLLTNDTELSAFVTDADRHQFKRRIQAEGLKFLTTTLPALGKALEASFAGGQFECPDGWTAAKGRAYPAFLSRAWEKIFNPKGLGWWLSATGSSIGLTAPVLQGEVGCATRCIRQLTLAFYKYEIPWTEDQAKVVFDQFIKTEDELWDTTKRLLDGDLDCIIDGRPLRVYLARAERLIARLLHGVSPLKINPCYGTGATAEKASLWGRWAEPRFIPKLDAVYPFVEWFCSGVNGLDARLTGSRIDAQSVEEPTARVVLVPKDSRGPRLISAEPSEFMYIQQGLFKALRDVVEYYPNVRTMVSIIDQTRNRVLAEWSSFTGSHATLDLKEASDRVSWWLVTRLFPPEWVEAFDACRSEATVMPSGDEIPLTKFAPMGSACCFPVESIVFWALANSAHKDWSEHRLKRMFSRSKWAHDMAEAGLTTCDTGDPRIPDISVFGDDIIVTTDASPVTISVLEAVGLLVNRGKSYTTGPFRESCGGDYVFGIDVSLVRVRHRLDRDNIGTMLRVKDIFNRISLTYGLGFPGLLLRLRELFDEFFKFQPPIVAVNHTNGTLGMILIDYHYRRNEPGMNPILKRQLSRVLWDSPPGAPPFAKVKRRISVRNQAKVDLCRVEYRVITEVADEVTRDLNWCSVLRSFCLKGGRGGADVYAQRKCVRHDVRWLAV